MKAKEITVGTEKEIAMAKKAQLECLKSIAEVEADFKDEEMIDYMAKYKESYEEMISIIEKKGNIASFWINLNRNFSLLGLFKKPEKMKMFKQMADIQ